MFNFEEQARELYENKENVISEEFKFTIQEQEQRQQETQEENLPIDIHYEKVTDWLVDRNFIPEDYYEQLKKINALIKHAFKELRDQHEENLKKVDQMKLEELVSRFLDELKREAAEIKEDEENVLNYFWSQKLMDILEKVDAAQGGGYLFGLVGGSKRLKLWRNVIALYEKQNVYLGEIASKLIKNVKYEITALQKMIKKNEKQIEDLNRREEDWKRTARDFQRKYREECDQLGIEGVNIEIEFPTLLEKQLPLWYEKLHQACQDRTFQRAMQYYLSFVSFMSGKDAIKNFDSIPVVRFVCQDDSSVLAWKKFRGIQIPNYNAKELENFSNDHQHEKQGKLNIESNGDNKTAEIDWSALDLAESIVTDQNEINWGNVDIELEKTLEINFDDGSSFDMNMIETENSTKDLKQIYEWSKESIFANVEIRNEFWNDIIELEAFISQRVIEKGGSSATSTTVEGEIFKDACNEIRNENLDELNRFHVAVRNVLQLLNDERFRQLIMLKTSKRYVDRITKSLQQKREMIDRMNENVYGVDVKRSDLEEGIKKLEPEIDLLIDRTRELQQVLQESISKLVKGRKINIFGDINIILKK